MKKIILFFNLFLFSFFSNSQTATNPLRGLYVDKFVKYNIISTGPVVYGPYNSDYSILGVDNDHDGIFEKEVELLKYAQQNHFTTLILYDVSKIFVDPPFMVWNNNAGYHRMVSLQDHLCRFMQDARTNYGITQILAAIGGASEASDVIDFNQMFSQPTSSFQYSQSQINSPYFNSRLQSLALQYSLGDPMLLPSEVAKYVLRTLSMTGCQCNQSFDGFVTEYEFWTAGSIAANDPLVVSYEILMNDLNQIKLISPTMKIAVYYGHIALSSSNLTCPTCPVEFTDGSSTITQNCMNYCSTYIGAHNSQTTYNGASQPFNFSTEGARRQYIYLGSELAAKGLGAGNISSVAFHLSSAGSALNNLQIRATTSTTISDLSSPYLGSFSASTANSTFTPSTSNLGYDEFTFTSPLNWNGTDNIIIDVSYDNDPNGTLTATGTSSTDYKTQTSGSLNNSVIYIAANNPSGSRTIQTLVPTTLSNNRPDISFRSSFVRRADEIFLEEYYRTTSQYNVATMNSTNENVFRATNTTDNTVIRPIMSAESKYYGGAPDNFLGEWLFSTTNNSDEQKSIFGAERDHYVPWLSTKQNFSYENQIEPGGFNWFTSSYLLHSFKNTALFYCNSPVCTTSAPLSVVYVGPREKNIHYLLKITDASSTPTQLAIGYTPDFSQNQTDIFSTVNFTLQEINAPYILELQLDYGNGTPLAIYKQQIEVSSNFKIAPIGYVPTTNISICDNQQVILKAAKTSNINWFRITDAGMPGDLIQQNGGEYFLASQSGEYYAMRTSGTCSSQASNHIILGGFDQTSFISPVCSTATIEKLTTINFPSTNYNNGNLHYKWNTGETTSSIFINPDNTNNRIFSVQISSNNDQCRAYATLPVSKGSFSLAGSSTLSSSNISCSNGLGSVTLSVSGLNYPKTLVSDGIINQYITWYGAGPITPQTITLPPGIYFATVINNGVSCSDQISFTIGSSSSYNFSNSITNASCNGGLGGINISMNTSGNYKFEWIGIPISDISNTSTTSDVTGIHAGTYTLKITEANSCNYQYIDFTVTEPTGFSNNGSVVTNVICNAGSNGAIAQTISPTPTSYNWNSGQFTTQNLSGITSGIYNCVVTNSSGCSQTFTYFVSQPQEFAFRKVTETPACFNSPTAAVEIEVCGGTPNTTNPGYSLSTVSHTWNYITGSDNHYTLSSVNPTTYTVTVTDFVGCSGTLSVPITSFPLPTVSITPANPSSICIGDNLALTATTGGTNYSWSTGVNCTTCNVITVPGQATPYTVVMTGVNNCTNSASVTVPLNSSCCGNFGTNNFTFTQGTPASNNYNLNTSLDLTGDLIINASTLAIAENVHIDTKGHKLTIKNGSFLFACGAMWAGIINSLGGEVHIEGNSNTVTINDALTAISSTNGYPIQIDGASFNYNWVCISLANGTFPSSSTWIKNSTFDCNHIITKSPHDGHNLITSIHINLSNVYGLVIGNVNANRNHFRTGGRGIYSRNSSYEVYNNEFNYIQIINNPKQKAIEAYGQAAREVGNSITIGGYNLNEQNSFTNYNVAVLTDGVEQVHTFNNTFNNCYSAISLSKILESQTKSNTISEFSYGIGIYDPVLPFIIGIGSCQQHVVENHFNPGSSYNSLHTYGQVAIEASNQIAQYGPVEINKNDILNSITGIHVLNSPMSQVINFNTYDTDIPEAALAPDTRHTGILVENSNLVLVLNNYCNWSGGTIGWGNGQSLLDLMRGIRVSNSVKCLLKENKVENDGAGINFIGDCSSTNLYCNTMKLCYNGVYLQDLTAVVSPQGTPTESWGNKWIDYDPGNPSARVDGNPFNPVLWYVDYSAGTAFDPCANPVPCVPNVIITNSSTGTYPCTAPFAPMDGDEREKAFGDAVRDSSIDDPDSTYFKYASLEGYFKAAYQDGAILNLNVSTDPLYQNKYYELLQSNIGKYQEVKDNIATGDKQAALQKLMSIFDQNLIEGNKKTVGSIILSDYDPSLDADSDTIQVLTNIANLHPFYGGEAVYWARAILHLIVEDVLPPFRRGHHKQLYGNLTNNFSRDKLFPNPANELVTFFSSSEFCENEYLEVTNLLQQKLQLYKLPVGQNNFIFNTVDLSSGIYTVRRLTSNYPVSETKLSIIK